MEIDMMMIEFSSSISSFQGNAAIHILRSAFGVAWSDRIRIIFAGDDLTDEDAMKALKVGMMHWTMITKNNDDDDNDE